MWVNDSFFENLPFPYFLIDKESGFIVKRSQLAKAQFPIKPSIRDYMEPTYHHLVDIAFNDHNKEGMEIPLCTISNEYCLFRVYSYQDAEPYFHLFLIPILNQQLEIEGVLNKITSKFSSFQQEIKDNKQYIDKTVMQIQKATVTHQHYQNIDKLAAGIAHEIRNPLTTVSGFIQLLKPYLKQIGKEQYAEIALDELNRANQIIYEFLNESKPTEDSKKPISLNKIVKDVSLLYESEAVLKNITINNQFASQDIEIVANDQQLKQVLVNLLKNAMEAIEARQELGHKGMINFYTFTGNDKASVFVEDNGCGIKQETLQRLFRPFHTTKVTGTGIGLSVCKKIIEDHLGTLSVDSTEGKGTTFRIDFPLGSFSKT